MVLLCVMINDVWLCLTIMLLPDYCLVFNYYYYYKTLKNKHRGVIFHAFVELTPLNRLIYHLAY